MTDEVSKFFFNLTPDRVLDAVEASGVRATGRVMALNSMENRVYQVEIESDGEPESRFANFRVAKFYRPGRWSVEEILEEHEFISELAGGDIPVVAPLKFPDGSTLKKLKEYEIWYALFPRVGGRIRDEYSESELERLGRLIARLHLIGASKRFKKRWKIESSEYGRRHLEYLLSSKALPDSVAGHYQRVVEQICTVSEPWFKGVPLLRVHGDLHLGNILWDNELCRLVDFDDTMTAPAVQDIWLICPGRDAEAVKSREIIISAYESFREFNRETLRLIEPLRAFRIVRFSAWIHRRWQDPAFPRVFEEFGTEKYWREQLIALDEIREIMTVVPAGVY
ncbi:MAG: serine/threonine protein kinase [Candidatus Dadabacteria bacterium]|nr:MAG: serine/threonine protein kinase [Candidatus Dadabacteria bacterium]